MVDDAVDQVAVEHHGRRYAVRIPLSAQPGDNPVPAPVDRSGDLPSPWSGFPDQVAGFSLVDEVDVRLFDVDWSSH
jgi:hypothetical protein